MLTYLIIIYAIFNIWDLYVVVRGGMKKIEKLEQMSEMEGMKGRSTSMLYQIITRELITVVT